MKQAIGTIDNSFNGGKSRPAKLIEKACAGLAKGWELAKDKDVQKQAGKALIQSAASIFGVRVITVLPEYFRQRKEIKGKKEQSHAEFTYLFSGLTKEGWEGRNVDQDKKVAEVINLEKIDELEEKINSMDVDEKTKDKIMDELNNLVENYHQEKEDLETGSNQNLKDVFDDYMTTKISGIQAAKEGLNTLIAAGMVGSAVWSGGTLTALVSKLRSASYGALSIAERGQAKKKQARSKKRFTGEEEKVGFWKDIIYGGAREVVQEAAFAGQGEAKDKVFKAIKSYGSLARFIGLSSFALARPEFIDKVIDGFRELSHSCKIVIREIVSPSPDKISGIVPQRYKIDIAQRDHLDALKVIEKTLDKEGEAGSLAGQEIPAPAEPPVEPETAAPVEIIKKNEYLWKAAKRMLKKGEISKEEFNRAWADSTVEIGGEDIPIHKVNLVHPGAKLVYQDGQFKVIEPEGKAAGLGHAKMPVADHLDKPHIEPSRPSEIRHEPAIVRPDDDLGFGGRAAEVHQVSQDVAVGEAGHGPAVRPADDLGFGGRAAEAHPAGADAAPEAVAHDLEHEKEAVAPGVAAEKAADISHGSEPAAVETAGDSKGDIQVASLDTGKETPGPEAPINYFREEIALMGFKEDSLPAQGVVELLQSANRDQARAGLEKIFGFRIAENNFEITKDGIYRIKNVSKGFDVLVKKDQGQIKFGVDGPFGKWKWGAEGRSWRARPDVPLTENKIKEAYEEINKMAKSTGKAGGQELKYETSGVSGEVSSSELKKLPGQVLDQIYKEAKDKKIEVNPDEIERNLKGLDKKTLDDIFNNKDRKGGELKPLPSEVLDKIFGKK